MKRWQYRLCCAVLVSALVALTGCAYQKAVRQLPPAAQGEASAPRHLFLQTFTSREQFITKPQNLLYTYPLESL